MAGIYVFSDIPSLAGELLRLARSICSEANIITFSEEDALKVQRFGADKVFVVQGESPLVESYSKSLAQYLALEHAELFLVGLTPRGRDLGARVAGYLDCAMISDALSLEVSDKGFKTEKMLYGGVAFFTETFNELSVVTMGPRKFDATTYKESLCEIIRLKADTRTQLVSRSPLVKGDTNIESAERVVCVGLGMNKQEDLKIAEELAQVIDAELACTRSIAEERKWLPTEQYIGISGAIIKPQMYLSMGVSGQVQHTAGIRDAETIISINLDNNASIFEAADYGIVGDMYEIVPLLTKAIKKAKE